MTVHFGADIGLVNDPSVLAGVDDARGYLQLVELVEMKPRKGAPLRLSAVIERFAAVMKRYCATTFLADGHVREPAREFAEQHGVTIAAAPEGQKGKAESYIACRKAMAEGRLRIPDHTRLRAQLASVISRPLPGGGLGITTPRRAGLAHGDLVSALVLAHWSAAHANVSRYDGAIRFTSERADFFGERGGWR